MCTLFRLNWAIWAKQTPGINEYVEFKVISEAIKKIKKVVGVKKNVSRTTKKTSSKSRNNAKSKTNLEAIPYEEQCQNEDQSDGQVHEKTNTTQNKKCTTHSGPIPHVYQILYASRLLKLCNK